ncbi:FCD domain-containing protein [Rhodococcoides fascians]|uniref:FCD domain-containing protein n=1 Tax=Rhodococcoides fascians TaxID=1828 RepID=UPI001D4A7027|nr:FCD domain-containing protein [Rhodococcus fascians]CAH0155643.1 hypothetical protein SRABI91_00822 [Rhodococcus fascians]
MAFHRSIVVASHNEILLELFGSMASRLRDAMIDMLRIAGSFGDDEDHDTHTDVVEAIAARDAQRAHTRAPAGVVRIDDLLFPIHHGILYYPGIDVLPPFVVHGSDRLTAEEYAVAAKNWERRLLELETTEPIAFRMQNFGDYGMPSLRLKDGLEERGQSSFALHVRS